LQLDPSVLKQAPFNAVPLMSLPAYCATLEVPGGFNWRRAAVTLLAKTGLRSLIPAARLVPRGADGDSDSDSVDPLLVIGGSSMAMTLFTAALSPLQLYAMGEGVRARWRGGLVGWRGVREARKQALTGAR